MPFLLLGVLSGISALNIVTVDMAEDNALQVQKAELIPAFVLRYVYGLTRSSKISLSAALLNWVYTLLAFPGLHTPPLMFR